jgi:hypothetical protein
LGGEANQTIATVYGDASREERLDILLHSEILQNITSILRHNH